MKGFKPLNLENVALRMVDNLDNCDMRFFLEIATRSEQHRMISEKADIDLFPYDVLTVADILKDLNS